MPFFPQTYLTPDTSFFQLLSELDKASVAENTPKQVQVPACAKATRHHQEETFTPRFDVTETPSSYELFGELPGLERKDLNIEFSDAQTISITGKVVRAGTRNTIDEAQTAQQTAATGEVEERDNDSSSVKSHSHSLAATVEDEYDAVDTPLSPNPAATTSTSISTSTTTSASIVAAPTSNSSPKPKFWVSERKVGSFARSFSFSQRIEHDNVQASLKNGVLHVVVPKAVGKGRIAVSVF